jgi:hypothetical protein
MEASSRRRREPPSIDFNAQVDRFLAGTAKRNRRSSTESADQIPRRKKSKLDVDTDDPLPSVFDASETEMNSSYSDSWTESSTPVPSVGNFHAERYRVPSAKDITERLEEKIKLCEQLEADLEITTKLLASSFRIKQGVDQEFERAAGLGSQWHSKSKALHDRWLQIGQEKKLIQLKLEKTKKKIEELNSRLVRATAAVQARSASLEKETEVEPLEDNVNKLAGKGHHRRRRHGHHKRAPRKEKKERKDGFWPWTWS